MTGDGSSRRRVLIIGNSDGIGAAVTKALVERGDHVVGISRSGSPLGPDGPRHEIHDATAPGYRELLSRLLDEEGGFDVCIFSVGVGSGLKLPDLSREAHVVEVNFVSLVRTMSILVPHFLERGSGHFVGLSSLADDLYNHDAPSYSAAKAGVSNYLVSMALKLRKHGVAVTNIRFGFVETKMAKSKVRPFMISREASARHVLRCLDKRPIQLSLPKAAGVLVRCARWAQSLRVWTR